MDIHHGCTCQSCGRDLKRNRGKRNHCGRAECRFVVNTQAAERQAARRLSPSEDARKPNPQAIVMMAEKLSRTSPHTNSFTTGH